MARVVVDLDRTKPDFIPLRVFNPTLRYLTVKKITSLGCISPVLSCGAMIEKNDVRKDTVSQLKGCHPFFKICTNPVSTNFRRGIMTRLQNC